jgi:hypothetical protein
MLRAIIKNNVKRTIKDELLFPSKIFIKNPFDASSKHICPRIFKINTINNNNIGSKKK